MGSALPVPPQLLRLFIRTGPSSSGNQGRRLQSKAQLRKARGQPVDERLCLSVRRSNVRTPVPLQGSRVALDAAHRALAYTDRPCLALPCVHWHGEPTKRVNNACMWLDCSIPWAVMVISRLVNGTSSTGTIQLSRTDSCRASHLVLSHTRRKVAAIATLG